MIKDKINTNEELEIWRDVQGYEGYYQVSSMANVRSILKRSGSSAGVLKLRKDRKGYPIVYLSVKSKVTCKRVHRLVAEVFIPNPDNKPFINHINGIKTDNSIENLEWCTQKENMQHAFKNGLVNVKGRKPVNRKGALHPYARRIAQFDLFGNKMREFNAIVEAQKETGIKASYIGYALQKEGRTSGGFIWKYLEKQIA